MEGENRWDEYPTTDDQLNTGDFSGLGEENNEDHYQNQPKNQIVEKLKIGGVIIGVAVVSLVSYFQFMKTLNMPVTALFAGENASADETPETETCTGGNCELQQQIIALLQQQKQDTDNDGLSDYEEIYVYQTSPFLEDSDSDSYSDKTEVNSGKDPNCPSGTDCFADLTNANTDAGQGYIDPGVQTFATGQSNSQTLRQMLLKSGFSKENLDLITDDQLVQVYQQVLSGEQPNFDAIVADNVVTGNSTATSSNVSVDASKLTSIEDLQALSGAQIRELMISQGAPTEMLSTLSDDELKQLFLGQLQERIDNSANQNSDQNITNEESL